MDRFRDAIRGAIGAGRGVPDGVIQGFPPSQPQFGMDGTGDTGARPIDGLDRKIGKKQIEKAADTLRKYAEGKQVLENTIVSNERWYRLRHWEELKRKVDEKTNITPTSAWLFNSLANKHADAMDNFPSPNVLPREQSDEQDAKTLSNIIPCILEQNEFESTYSDVWWYKLKNGTGVYGVFWDTDKENGLGDVSIRKIDLLNVYWEPGITSIEDSPNLFIVQLVDDEQLHRQYPELKNRNNVTPINVKQYTHDDNLDVSDKSLVVDWYYKVKDETGKHVLHYVKFCGDTLLYSSEDDPECVDGFYQHGHYPVVFDVMFPSEGEPVGFGYINVMRDPQMYIDKLSQIVMQNAYLCGRPRYFFRRTNGIDEKDFMDWTKDLVPVDGSLDEDHVRLIDVKPLPGFISQHLEYKVNELKETSGNRDFSQGGTAGGVTAASAIAALQEAGNKLSRDMLKESYRAYQNIVYLVIELIRQFYTEERTFRIDGENGGMQFVAYNNAGIQDQQLPNVTGDGIPMYRRPVFDIRVVPQRSNPFNRLSQNELAKELYGLGVFNPAAADQALGLLDMMDFEGKQKVVERVQQGQTMMMIIQQLQQQNAQLMAMVDKLTGGRLSEGMEPEGQQPSQAPAQTGEESPGTSQVRTSRQAQSQAAANAQGAAQQRIGGGM